MVFYGARLFSSPLLCIQIVSNQSVFDGEQLLLNAAHYGGLLFAVERDYVIEPEYLHRIHVLSEPGKHSALRIVVDASRRCGIELYPGTGSRKVNFDP